MTYLNVAAYKFIDLSAPYLLKLHAQLREQAAANNIRGTILLSVEGINLFLAGEFAAMGAFTTYLVSIPEFADLPFKLSESATIPFKRLLVRIKKEIITMQQDAIQPAKQTAPYIEPAQLKNWYENQQPMVMLDTRNNYEFAMGTFSNAIHLDIENFSQFPQAVTQLPEVLKNQPIVTFCTGGIRCEKAAAYLLQQGFNQVWQLKGGILNYFAQCQGDYYEGDCFVFDARIALDTQLTENQWQYLKEQIVFGYAPTRRPANKSRDDE